MPCFSGPLKNSGNMVMRSKRISFQSNEWRSRLSCAPSHTRQPAWHLPAILFILRTKFRLEPGLLDGKHEQNHAHSKCCNQLQEHDRVKDCGLSEHHKCNTPIHWIAHNPISPTTTSFFGGSSGSGVPRPRTAKPQNAHAKYSAIPAAISSQPAAAGPPSAGRTGRGR